MACAGVDEATRRFTDVALQSARQCIPKRTVTERPGEHPWLNDECRAAIRAKHAHEGAHAYEWHRNRCSEVLARAHGAHIARVRMQLRNLGRGSKAWWKLSAQLLRRKGKASGVPALRNGDGAWVRDPQGKANEFAEVWFAKLASATFAPELSFELPGGGGQFFQIRLRHVQRVLMKLNVAKATGPDGLPARILREVARSIAWPVAVLCRRMLAQAVWPETWRTHNLHPLFKRGSPIKGATLGLPISRVFCPRSRNECWAHIC